MKRQIVLAAMAIGVQLTAQADITDRATSPLPARASRSQAAPRDISDGIRIWARKIPA